MLRAPMTRFRWGAAGALLMLGAVLSKQAFSSPAPQPASESAATPAMGTFVVCAPGYPGSTAEAQPTMDLFSAAISQAAGWKKGDFRAVYFETEEGGLDRLRQPDASVGMVPLPFFLKHGAELKLTPRLVAIQVGSDGTEVWSLVAKKGRVTSSTSLENWQIVSNVGYAPKFIRGPVLGKWGRLPASVKVTSSGRVLSALRKAATGEDVALVVDRETVASLSTLPFGADLEVVTRSEALPQGFLCTVGKHLSSDAWKTFSSALAKLKDEPAGAKALETVRLTGFTKLDEKGLAAVRQSYDRAESTGQ